MRIAICDDDRQMLEGLEQIMRSCGGLPPNASVHRFSSGTELVERYEERGGYDLVILDIEMPGLSGLETGHKLRELDRNLMISFLTSHAQYMARSIEIQIFGYLVKPPKPEEVDYLLRRASKKYQEMHYEVPFTCGDREYRRHAKEIIYMENYKRKTRIYVVDREEPYECREKFKDFVLKLVPYGFVKCHQSCLINMEYIEEILDDVILTTTGQEVEMSVRMKRDALRAYNHYLSRHDI